VTVVTLRSRSQLLKDYPELNSYYEKLKDWQWRFGETPEFTHQMEEKFTWGHMDVNLDTHKGKVTNVKIFSDGLHPEMIEYLMEDLTGRDYTPESIYQGIEATKNKLPMIADYLDEFSRWLLVQIR